MPFPLALAALGGGGSAGGHGSAGPSSATNTGNFGDEGSSIFNNPIVLGGFKTDGSSGAVFPVWAIAAALGIAALLLLKRFGK